MISKKLSIVGRLVFFIPAITVYFLSTLPTYTFSEENDSALVIGLKHITDKVHICSEEEVKRFLEKESEKERTHLRKRARLCGSRDRVPLKMVVWFDGAKVLDKQYDPAGFRDDGKTFVYEKFMVPVGRHTLKMAMHGSKREKADFNEYNFEKTIDFTARQSVNVSFDSIQGEFVISD